MNCLPFKQASFPKETSVDLGKYDTMVLLTDAPCSLSRGPAKQPESRLRTVLIEHTPLTLSMIMDVREPYSLKRTIKAQSILCMISCHSKVVSHKKKNLVARSPGFLTKKAV